MNPTFLVLYCHIFQTSCPRCLMKTKAIRPSNKHFWVNLCLWTTTVLLRVQTGQNSTKSDFRLCFWAKNNNKFSREKKPKWKGELKYPLLMCLHLEPYRTFTGCLIRTRQTWTLSKPQPSFKRHNAHVIYLAICTRHTTLHLTVMAKPDGADRFVISECRVRICWGCGAGWMEEGGEEGTQWVLGEREDRGSLRGKLEGIFFFFHLSVSHPLIHVSPSLFLSQLLHSESSFSYL